MFLSFYHTSIGVKITFFVKYKENVKLIDAKLLSIALYYNHKIIEVNYGNEISKTGHDHLEG